MVRQSLLCPAVFEPARPQRSPGVHEHPRHVGFANLSMTPLRRGFDSFFGFWGGSEDHWSHVTGHLDFREGEAIARNYSSTDKSNASYSTHLFSRRAVEIIEAHAEDSSPPFFIYLAYQATHAPLQAPPDVVASFAHVRDPSRRTFAAMAAVVDEGIGNITAALTSSGNERTVLFLSGDNGGTIRAGGNNYPLRGFKGSLWEGGCRASAFVWSPLLPARRNFVWRGLFHVSDWLPTALEVAGVADPLRSFPELDGFPMWKALASGGSSPRTVSTRPLVALLTRQHYQEGSVIPCPSSLHLRTETQSRLRVTHRWPSGAVARDRPNRRASLLVLGSDRAPRRQRQRRLEPAAGGGSIRARCDARCHRRHELQDRCRGVRGVGHGQPYLAAATLRRAGARAAPVTVQGLAEPEHLPASAH